jgi:hypothetical protein
VERSAVNGRGMRTKQRANRAYFLHLRFRKLYGITLAWVMISFAFKE